MQKTVVCPLFVLFVQKPWSVPYSSLLMMVLVGCANTGGSKGAVATHEHGDYAKELSHWRPLPEQEFAEAQANLGFIYDENLGVPQDYAKELGWYSKAAEQGDAKAQYNLGIMYCKGQGVPQDYVEAHKWFYLAATAGNANAAKARDLLADKMTPAQIRKAREWRPKKGK